MLPKAMLWDASETALASEEGVPIAWFDRSQDQWLYGTLGVPASSELDEKLQLLADELGMTVAELGYVSGDAIPAEVLAAMEAGALFQEGPIEDLRNLNMNFIIDLGDVDGGQVTMRIIPNFADIVSAARTKQQFTMAAILDAAANVPFFHSGDHELYQAAIDEMLALDGSKIAAALDSMSFRFAQAFSSLGFEYSRNQIAMMRDSRRPAAGTDGVMSSQGSANTHKAGDDLYWIFGLDGARAAYDTTSDGIGYDIGFTAVSIGLEKVVDANFSYGVLLGGSFGTAEAYSGRGEIESNGLSLAAFARSRFGDGGFLQGMLGYQDLSYESEREIMGRTAKGDTDGSQVFASLDAEYMFPSGAFNFGPTASLEYYKISVDSFKESGADIFNLTFGEQSGDLMLGTIGVRGDYLIPNAAGGTLLTGSLGYTFADGDDISVQTGLVGLPGASYTIAGMDDDWVDLQIGFESNLDMSGKSQGIIRGGYRGSYGSSYESHGIHLGLNVEF